MEEQSLQVFEHELAQNQKKHKLSFHWYGILALLGNQPQNKGLKPDRAAFRQIG